LVDDVDAGACTEIETVAVVTVGACLCIEAGVGAIGFFGDATGGYFDDEWLDLAATEPVFFNANADDDDVVASVIRVALVTTVPAVVTVPIILFKRVDDVATTPFVVISDVAAVVVVCFGVGGRITDFEKELILLLLLLLLFMLLFALLSLLLFSNRERLLLRE